jgi:transposase
MRTTSLDLRERILAAYDNEDGTREDIARRFRVSLGLVKKLLAQRQRTGDIAPRHRFTGRKPLLVAAHRGQLRAMLAKETDMTLREMRDTLKLDCSLQAIHKVLDKMGLTLKKRRSAQASKTAPTLPGRAGRGGGSRAGSTRRG